MYKMKADGVVFYDPASDEMSLQVLSPKVKHELNKAGTLTFTLLPGNVMHEGLHKLKTVITLERDGEIVFRGRVLETATDLYNQKEVYCEGDLAFLLDSIVRPYQFKGKASDLLRQLVTKHNEQVEAYKHFVIGIITAVTDTDVLETEGGGYADTMSEIKSLLLDGFGGYLRVRHENGLCYLDYLDAFNQTCSQAINFGVNLVDIENKVNAQEVCTVLVPLGNNGTTIETVNGGKDYIEDTEAIAQYGRIVKTHTWENVEDPAFLLELAREYMEKMAAETTLTIRAVDLHDCGVDTDGIHLGDTVKLHSIPHGLDREDVCTAIDQDIANPEKTEYTFGFPQETLTESNARTIKGLQHSINDQHRWLTETETALNINVEAVNLIGHRTTQLEIDVDAAEEAITLKADQTSVDILEDRTSSAEARIDAAEAAILLKADQKTVTEQGERLSAAEADISAAEAAILLKTDLTVTEGLDKRVSTAEADIDAAEAAIKLLATKEEVSDVSSTLSTVQADLDAAEAAILLKADLTVTEGLDKRVSTAEADIDAAEAAIKLLATKEEVSDVSSTLSTVQADLDAAEAAILLKADKTVTDGLTTRMNTAEADIDAANAAIALKASQSTVDEQGELISTVQADLDAAEAAILLKASQTDMDDVLLRLDGAEDSITAQASTINLKADKTYVDNLYAQTVKTDELEAELADVVRLAGGIAVIDRANISTLMAEVIQGVNSISGDYAWFDTVYVGEAAVTSNMLAMGDVVSADIFAPNAIDLSHSHKVTVNTDGTITLGEVATTGGTFKIADTAYYKNGVSAAYADGAADRWGTTSVYFPDGAPLYSYDASAQKYTVTAYTAYFDGASTPAGTKSGTYTFSASAAFDDGYDSGYDDGYSTGNTAGYNSGYADAKPASVSRVSTYDSAANAYNVTVAVKSADGTSKSFALAAVSADAAFYAGYADAVNSATFSVEGTNVVVTFGDGSTKSFDVDSYVSAQAETKYVSSTDTTITVRANAHAYFNGVYCGTWSAQGTYDTV